MCYCSLCDRLNLREKTVVFAYEISRRKRIFHEFAFENKEL